MYSRYGDSMTRVKHVAAPSTSNELHIKYRLDGSPLIGPEKRKKKAIRTKNCLSDSEFFSFRFFLSIAGSEPAPAKAGDNRRGRLFLVTYFGEAKKVTRRQAKPALGIRTKPAKNELGWYQFEVG